jgi:outer membrane protein TolC
LSTVLSACVAYRPAPIDVVSLSHSAPTPPPGPLSYPDAVRFALAHNPDLLALRARSAAVNRSWSLEEFDVDSVGGGITVDVVGLLHLGESKTQVGLANAQSFEAVMRHHERAWEVAAAIAEAYEVERALAGLALPDVSVPAEAWVRAGLAPESARTAADANVRGVEAEAAARSAARRENALDLLRLLGARPDAAVTIVLDPVVPAPLPDPSWAALLRARPDLRRETAAYRVADAEFRRAVAMQYPHLIVNPPMSSSFDVLDVVSVTLPLRAPARAHAASRAREAARLEARAAVLSAMREAAATRVEADRAAVAAAAARERAQADVAMLRTARTRLEAESGSFLESVFAAQGAVESAEMLREAVIADARARARAAKATGWPVFPEIDCRPLAGSPPP